MTSSERIRVMVADDHPIMRNGLREALDAEEDFEVVGQASDGDGGGQHGGAGGARRHRDGRDDARQGRGRRLPGDHGRAAEDAGADAHGVHDGGRGDRSGRRGGDGVPAEALGSRGAGGCDPGRCAGAAAHPGPVDKAGLPAGAGTARPHRRPRCQEAITERERDILRLFASGKSYAQIAEARGNKASTIKNAIYHIQEKLGVESKQEIVVWAVRNGLLEGEEEGE